MTPPWNSPEKDITPEEIVHSRPKPITPENTILDTVSEATGNDPVPTRRRFLRTASWSAGGIAAGAALGSGLWWLLNQATDAEVLRAGQVPGAANDLYPAERNPEFAAVDRAITGEADAARYCNFYEFSAGKSVFNHVGPFATSPWTVEVTGEVARPQTFDLDTLVRTFPLEERVYRHRCVEAWAMVVPWVGFPLRELIRRVEPYSTARFVKFVSFHRPEQASRQRIRSFPWPYSEGLSLDEANNELTFLCTGMYGHPLLKQHGAPIRLVVPWKYGFKSAKSIARIEFSRRQPATFWNTVQPHEYGFWANVDPDVPHPRWSQASERMLGTGERFATRKFNGYGEWVARLYED